MPLFGGRFVNARTFPVCGLRLVAISSRQSRLHWRSFPSTPLGATDVFPWTFSQYFPQKNTMNEAAEALIQLGCGGVRLKPQEGEGRTDSINPQHCQQPIPKPQEKNITGHAAETEPNQKPATATEYASTYPALLIPGPRSFLLLTLPKEEQFLPHKVNLGGNACKPALSLTPLCDVSTLYAKATPDTHAAAAAAAAAAELVNLGGNACKPALSLTPLCDVSTPYAKVTPETHAAAAAAAAAAELMNLGGNACKPALSLTPLCDVSTRYAKAAPETHAAAAERVNLRGNACKPALSLTPLCDVSTPYAKATPETHAAAAERGEMDRGRLGIPQTTGAPVVEEEPQGVGTAVPVTKRRRTMERSIPSAEQTLQPSSHDNSSSPTFRVSGQQGMMGSSASVSQPSDAQLLEKMRSILGIPERRVVEQGFDIPRMEEAAALRSLAGEVPAGALSTPQRDDLARLEAMRRLLESNTPEPKDSDISGEKKTILKVRRADADTCLFEVKSTTPMGKLLHRYCIVTDSNEHFIHFQLEGNPVEFSATVETLGLQDGNTIDVIIRQGREKNSEELPFPVSGM